MKAIPLSCLTLAMLAAPAAAQGILPYLPKETMFAVSAPDISMSMAEFQQMPLAKMWAEEEVQTFFADALDLAADQLNQGIEMAKQMHADGQFPIDPEQLLKLRVNGGTVALTHLELVQGDFGAIPKFGMIVHIDFGDSAESWAPLIQMGLGMLQAAAGDEIERTDDQIGDVSLISMAPTDAPSGMEMSLNVAMVPNGVVIGTLADDVKALITNMTNRTPALSAAPGFAAAAKHIDVAGAEAQVFVAPDPLVDFALGTLRTAIEHEPELEDVDFDGVERALQAMGLRNLGTAAVATSYVDGKCITRGYHANGQGGTAAAAQTVDINKFLRWVPKDAVSFGIGTLNVASFYDTLLKGLQAYDAQLAERMLAKLAELEGQLGFTIRGDLFGSIGDHYVTWSMPMGTIASTPEVAYVLKVNNEEKLVGALQTFSAMTQGMVEIEEGTKRGVKVYQVHINYDPFEGGGMAIGMNPFDMIQPTFSFKDGYMVLGFSASDIKRVFKRMDRDDNPKGDIRGNKEFAAIAGAIPSDISDFSFTDWKSNFESLYQMLTGMLAFVPMPEDVPIDMSLLPDAETLTQHLYASMSYTRADANGTETVDVSPFGPETWLAIGLAIAAGVGTATWMEARNGF
ncbi:MAG TPA: hypothetical protein ENI87_00715 [bacterium]|nr:hypothetical protein [bacterium]